MLDETNDDEVSKMKVTIATMNEWVDCLVKSWFKRPSTVVWMSHNILRRRIN